MVDFFDFILLWYFDGLSNAEKDINTMHSCYDNNKDIVIKMNLLL